MPEAECSTFGRSDAAAGSRGKSVTVLRDRYDLPKLSFLAERREGIGIDMGPSPGKYRAACRWKRRLARNGLRSGAKP